MGNFACLFPSDKLPKMDVFKYNLVGDAIRVSNNWDPDQDQRIVRSSFGPNCLKRISAGGTSIQTIQRTKTRPDNVGADLEPNCLTL